MNSLNYFLINSQTNFEPQFLQFFCLFSRYFALHSFSCAIFSSKLYLKFLSKLEIQQASNFTISNLSVNSTFGQKTLIPLVRSQTRKTNKFLTLEQNFINFMQSLSFLTSVFHQVSHPCFQSFDSLIRLEKGFTKHFL